MSNDNRPRVNYLLPDGTIAPIIFDHDDRIPAMISFALAGGKVVYIPLVDASLQGTLAGRS